MDFIFFPGKYCFHVVLNTKKDLDKSGVSSFVDLISEHYEKINGSVLINSDHILVRDLIKNISKIEKKEEIKYEPFVETKCLENALIKKKNHAFGNLEEILRDLNKMGQIIFFNNNDYLKNLIVTDPQWLNEIFKNILDLGRKNLQFYLEDISEFKKISPTCKKIVDEEIKILKFKCKKNLNMAQIWENPREKEKSIVDKISFLNLLKKVEEIEILMIKDSYKDTKEFFQQKLGNENTIAQKIFRISHKEFLKIIELILGIFSNIFFLFIIIFFLFFF